MIRTATRSADAEQDAENRNEFCDHCAASLCVDRCAGLAVQTQHPSAARLQSVAHSGTVGQLRRVPADAAARALASRLLQFLRHLAPATFYPSSPSQLAMTSSPASPGRRRYSRASAGQAVPRGVRDCCCHAIGTRFFALHSVCYAIGPWPKTPPRTSSCGSGAPCPALPGSRRCRPGSTRSPRTPACPSCASAGRTVSLDADEDEQSAEVAALAAQDADDSATVSVGQLLDQLPERYRQAVVLFYMEDKSYEQTAASLGLPLGTVKALLHRARKRLIELTGSRSRMSTPIAQPADAPAHHLEWNDRLQDWLDGDLDAADAAALRSSPRRLRRLSQRAPMSCRHSIAACAAPPRALALDDAFDAKLFAQIDAIDDTQARRSAPAHRAGTAAESAAPWRAAGVARWRSSFPA